MLLVYRGMTQARVQCDSLPLIFYLWSKPHYRNSTFKVPALAAVFIHVAVLQYRRAILSAMLLACTVE